MKKTVSNILYYMVLLLMISLALTLVRSNLQEQIDATNRSVEELQVENKELKWELEQMSSSLQELEDKLKAHEQEVVATIYKPVCSTGTWKSWMDYNAITSPSSRQWALQKLAVTDETTGYRMVGKHIMVAMGPMYGPVGQKLKLFFEDGQSLSVIIGDIKHQGCVSGDGSMLEFIVDKTKMLPSIKRSGTYNDLYKGRIVAIAVEPAA